MTTKINDGRTDSTCSHPDLTIRPSHHRHQLRDLLALFGLVAARDRVLDAMADVILQDFFFDSPQGSAYRRNLRDDVDAVAIIIDHLR